MTFVHFRYSLPHRFQDLTATTDFVILLFPLLVSLSDVPHLPTCYEVLRSPTFLMPTTVNIYPCKTNLDTNNIRKGHASKKYLRHF